MDVRRAESATDLEEVRRLFRSFRVWHRQRHTEDLDLIEAYFDEAAYQHEIDSLPGVYAPPGGELLICEETGLVVGCVALKRIDESACEMKRMFVAPTARGGGAGRALAEAALERAREAGYRETYLDTSIRQTEAIGLYRDLGFEQVEPYYDVPTELRDWLVFFRLTL